MRYSHSAMARRHRRVQPSSGIESFSPLLTGVGAFAIATVSPSIGAPGSSFGLVGTIVTALTGNTEVAKQFGAATAGFTGGLLTGMYIRLNQSRL